MIRHLATVVPSRAGTVKIGAFLGSMLLLAGCNQPDTANQPTRTPDPIGQASTTSPSVGGLNPAGVAPQQGFSNNSFHPAASGGR